MKNVEITLKNWLHNFNHPSKRSGDLLLLFVVFIWVFFGLIMVYSSSFIYAQDKMGDGFFFIKRQMIFAFLGFIGLFCTSRIPHRYWFNGSYFILGLVTLGLCLVCIPGIGVKVGGARRWLNLGGIRFQPAEFAKFGILFFAASQLERKSDRLHTITSGILSHFFLTLPAFLLLLLQPDFGTTAMIVLVIFTLLFVGGVRLRDLMIAASIAGMIGIWLILHAIYRKNRLLAFLDPWSDPGGKGFQILQSLTGIHQGRFWGVGLGNGQEKLFYLPEAHNDFILSVIGEELGWLGITSILAVNFFLIYRGLKIAWNAQKLFRDRFGMLLATSITLALGFQSLINSAVVLGLLPTKGLTLPFISYGGSALLADLAAIGILFRISKGDHYS